MRKLRLTSCLIVCTLCCLLLAPVASAAPTFASDLARYRTSNETTSNAARELAAYVATERTFARSVKRNVRQSPILVRTYLITFDQIDSATRRIVRDQRASDRVLADVMALVGDKRMDAAWILLKRGAAGQERFLTTIARTRLLVAKCKVLHVQLKSMGG
jgi:hypothetical protein